MAHCFRTIRLLSVLLSILLFAATAVAPLRADLSLEDIIENVRRNEALYSDIDLSIKCEYSIGDRAPSSYQD